jgi:hypothetical protein
MKMAKRNPPTTESAIAKFEQDRGINLPAGYRDFLLETNGGVPEDTAFPVDGMSNTAIWTLQTFAGIGVAEPTDELAYSNDLYAAGIPNGIVLIAIDDGGSFVALDLRQGLDRVAFWDHRHFWGTGEWRESDFYHVADSFREFLASLRPNPY